MLEYLPAILLVLRNIDKVDGVNPLKRYIPAS